MTRKILWHKWLDPLAQIYYNHSGEEDEGDDRFIASRDSFNKEDEPHYNPGFPNHPIGPTIVGPHGVIPLHESTLPGKLYNFWTGHTNFDLDEIAINKIANVPGVETLDIFTRYRFRLGIGKAFKQENVKEIIEKTICQSGEKVSGINAIKANLKKKYKCWAIYVMPDGHCEYVVGANKEEVKEKGEGYEKLARQIEVSW